MCVGVPESWVGLENLVEGMQVFGEISRLWLKFWGELGQLQVPPGMRGDGWGRGGLEMGIFGGGKVGRGVFLPGDSFICSGHTLCGSAWQGNPGWPEIHPFPLFFSSSILSLLIHSMLLKINMRSPFLVFIFPMQCAPFLSPPLPFLDVSSCVRVSPPRN